MDFLPKALGTRPRLACEVRAEGVVAARAEDAAAILSAVAQSPLASGVQIPHVQMVHVPMEETQRQTLVAAIGSSLEQVMQRGRTVTLVVPDTAVRVLLLDFDSLPTKAADALPLIRFRLKKLLPFDADTAAVSYQVMELKRDSTQVLAVAMPRELRDEYEGLVREAGFEPGALLPSTLAALSSLPQSERPVLVVNAVRDSVTTAIVRSGVLLLHRTMDLIGAGAVPSLATDRQPGTPNGPADTTIAAIAARLATASEPGSLTEGRDAQTKHTGWTGFTTTNPDLTDDIVQAVSVAIAYFEDTLEVAPSVVVAAGTFGADLLTTALDQAQVAPVAVEEIVGGQVLGAGAESVGTPGGVPLGWLAGVRGALAN